MSQKNRNLFDRAAELSAAGRSYAFATVVAVARPTSARPGAHGIIHPDGSIEGWVGGSCAQPVVIREALHAMRDGQPRLLRLSKDAPAEGRRADGVIELVMTCHSGGTLEIYVEPNLPKPQLWIAGITPIAGALVELGAAAGFQVTLFDPIADGAAFPAATAVRPDTNLVAIDRDVAPYVVVATQGQWDEEALAGALRRDARYVGLVASPTRAAAVRAWLREETGLAEDRLAALRAPAGMDLGAETPEEIALSILAELIQVRRGRADFVASPGPATVAGEAEAAALIGAGATALANADDIVTTDPVCGMEVDPAHARHLAEHDGTIYAFCSIGCRTRFVREPAVYLAAPGTHAMETEAT
ncbi:MAG TPA: XdhC family protein [Candidatus Limnocylindrales bacterium]|nr:XdhC family protein [Candidatus Limnocylindrales bacterium]